MRKKKLTAALALAVSSAIALLLAAFATGASQSPAQVIGSGKQSKVKSVCGLGTGKKATGAPIKIGAIATKQPGTDFTDIPNMAKAYFDCENYSGGTH